MKVSEAFPGKYLSADDLDGREIRLTIARVEQEQVGRDRDLKPVVYFTKARKGMVLNKTNARAIAAAYGDEMMQWEDREVVLFSMKVQFGDEIVDGIRVRVPKAVPEPPQATIERVPQPAPAPRKPAASYDDLNPPLDDDVPF